MNTYNINDPNFINSSLYIKFLNDNPKQGRLKIRAYAANQALPISGLKIVISTLYDNSRIIFYEGETDSSGIIEKIILPAPTLDTNNLSAPNKTEYEISATYTPDNINTIYKINIYENICVVQNIDIVPQTEFVGGYLGS